jgi:hypothetical protein
MTPDEVPLRDYMELLIKGLEAKLDAQSKFNAQHFGLNEIAIKKSEEAMLLRLENMNKFREQIQGERGALATKEWVGIMSEGLCTRLDKLENNSAFSAGKMWMVMAIFAAVPTVIALIALFAR